MKIRHVLVPLMFALTALGAPGIHAAPSWTLEGSVGLYEPEDDNWSEYYGSARMPEVSVSVAKRLFSVIDLGFSVNYGLDKGTGVLPISGLKSGSVTYDMAPIDLFIVLRGRFTENQWVVPYIGGGYTRFNYRQTIKDEGDTRGGVNGQHLRAGLQILLDFLEEDSAREIYANYGVINSYLILEGRKTTASVTADDGSDIELGGISYKAGIMLEFR